MKLLVLSIAAVAAVTACAAPSSEGGGDRSTPTSGSGLHETQSAEVVPYGYGPCAEEPKIGRVGFPGEKPVLVKRVAPSAIGPEIEGIVIIQAVVGRDGKICSAKVVRSLAPEADRAAIDAVKQWRFQPATYAGEPWPVEMHLTVNFGSHPSP